MALSLSLPWRSSSSDPICPAQRFLTACHFFAGSGLIFTVTS